MKGRMKMSVFWRGVSSGCRSEVVQQPDAYPMLIEHAVDVTEEPVDQGLHGDPFLVVAGSRSLVVECCSKFSFG
jgi:hypothetical protein